MYMCMHACAHAHEYNHEWQFGWAVCLIQLVEQGFFNFKFYPHEVLCLKFGSFGLMRVNPIFETLKIVQIKVWNYSPGEMHLPVHGYVLCTKLLNRCGVFT